MAQYPKHYEWMMDNFGELIQAHQQFGLELQKAGPLDRKTAQLVQLAGAASNQCEGAVRSHVKRALECGAEPMEIYHTVILLASTIGFPAMAAALSWVREILEQASLQAEL